RQPYYRGPTGCGELQTQPHLNHYPSYGQRYAISVSSLPLPRQADQTAMSTTTGGSRDSCPGILRRRDGMGLLPSSIAPEGSRLAIRLQTLVSSRRLVLEGARGETSAWHAGCAARGLPALARG